MRVLDVARRLAAVAVVLAVTSPAFAADPAPAAASKDATAKAPAAADAAAKDQTATKKKARRDPGINQPGAAGNRGVTPGRAGNVGPGR